jgi:Peptidase family S41
MKRLILAAVLLLSTLVSHAQVNAPSIPQATNLDFEQGAAGATPPGWVTPAKGYEAKIVEGDASSGKKSASLTRAAGVSDAHAFGNIMQSVDATPYRGRWVRVRAAIKLQNPTGPQRAQLWLRVDRSGDRGGFFDNSNERPVRAATWTYVDITGDVDADAKSLNFGVISQSGATVLVDDFTVTDLGKVEVRVEPAKPLTDRGLTNLIAFTRLFGYVRHFHPSDQAASANWERVAIDGVRAVEGARTSAELIAKLDAVFRPLAPTLELYPTGRKPSKVTTTATQRDNPLVYTWKHRGFGQTGGIYRSDREKGGVTDVAGTNPLKPYQADLGGGVSARIPLAVYVEDTPVIPTTAAKPPPPATPVKYSGDDRATRLANVVLIWNVIQHFYPYFDIVKTDWNQTLATTLKSAAADAGEREFLDTLRRMIATIEDGHGSVSHSSQLSNASVPVLFGWIENKLVVTHVGDPALNLRPGDIVERVDGKPSADVFRELETTISGATPQWRRAISLNRLRTGAENSELRLDVRSPGAEPRAVSLRRRIMPLLEEPRPPKVHEIEPKIFYLDLTRMEDADWTNVVPRLADARGVIFDMRGYPRLGPTFLQHLTDKPLQSAQWNVPIVTRPDRNFSEWDKGGRWDLEPKAPRINAKVVFLTDGRAISYAESVMGIVEAYKLGAIVGEPTAGTNGNVNPVSLPGGYRVVWTGMKVLKHDGSRHHGVGILPTVPISRTIKGITEKRDEQLERALALVR